MSLENSFSGTDSVINKTLFTISGADISLFSVGLFLVVIIGTVFLSKAIQRTLSKTLRKRFLNREGTLAALLRLLHYLILITGIFIGLQLIGINLSALFAAGAVFLRHLLKFRINNQRGDYRLGEGVHKLCQKNPRRGSYRKSD